MWIPLQQRLGTLMTREKVAGIVAYCEEKKISYKQRLDVLGSFQIGTIWANLGKSVSNREAYKQNKVNNDEISKKY